MGTVGADVVVIGGTSVAFGGATVVVGVVVGVVVAVVVDAAISGEVVLATELSIVGDGIGTACLLADAVALPLQFTPRKEVIVWVCFPGETHCPAVDRTSAYEVPPNNAPRSPEVTTAVALPVCGTVKAIGAVEVVPAAFRTTT